MSFSKLQHSFLHPVYQRETRSRQESGSNLQDVYLEAFAGLETSFSQHDAGELCEDDDPELEDEEEMPFDAAMRFSL